MHHALASYLILLVIACTVALAVRWIKVPYTIALVLVGLVLAVARPIHGLVISEDIIFTLILPPLLFYGALHMDLEDLKTNWVTVAMLAVPGVVLSTVVIGFLVHWLWQVDLLVGLLFGALLTPTDPISVLAICREVGAPKRLRILLEGESLFNDGTGIVVYGLLLGMILEHQTFAIGSSILQFLGVALGGMLVGGLLGLAAYRLLKTTSDHLVELTVTSS